MSLIFADDRLLREPPACYGSLSECLLGIGNGVGKQGRGNQPAYRRYGPDTEIQYRPREPHGLAKQAELSPKGKPIWNFSIDSTSSIRTPIADAIFADAISETPMSLGPFRPRAPECPKSAPSVSKRCPGTSGDTLGTLSGHSGALGSTRPEGPKGPEGTPGTLEGPRDSCSSQSLGRTHGLGLIPINIILRRAILGSSCGPRYQ